VVAEGALVELLHRLDSLGYDFVTPTPLTHERVLRNRRGRPARTLRDVFGWSLAFAQEILEPDLLALLERAEALVPGEGGWRSRYRVSRAHGKLFLHSAYPTAAADAVFFGPDSYRFADFVLAELPPAAARLVDMGAGSGVGGICAAPGLPGASVVLVDSNPEAARLARINAAAAGTEVETLVADGLDSVAGEVDLVIANPPFLVDEARRAYRHGGAMLGAGTALTWASEAARRLAPGGRIILYTGSAIVEGRDSVRDWLAEELPEQGCTLRYREIDPDIFGEELEREAYRDVDRIAAVGAVIGKTG
jgi:methylase of polypeptide subunit release factors